MDRHVMRALSYRDEFSAALTAGTFVFSDAENPFFRKYMDDIFRKIGYKPTHFSRRTATRDCDNSMLSIWDDVKTDVHATLGDTGLISITFDYGSRAGSQQPIIGMTGHAISTSFTYMKSWVLGAMDAPGSHTLVRTRVYATKIMNRYELPPQRVRAASHDAGSNTTAFNEAALLDIFCFGHGADTVVKKVKADKNGNQALFGARRSFAQMTNGVRLIVKEIRISTLRREHFRTVQTTLDPTVEPRMVICSPNHKFVFDRREVERALDLANAIYQIDKNMMGRTIAEKNEWTANVSSFKKDVPDLKLIAPVLAETEDLLTFLGTSAKPRIGFVIFAINRLYQTVGEKIAQADDDGRPNALATLKHFDLEFHSAFDDWLTSPVYQVAQLLTPERGCRLTRNQFQEAWEIVQEIHTAATDVVGPAPAKRQRLSLGLVDEASSLTKEKEVYTSFLDGLFDVVFEEKDSVTYYKPGVVAGQFDTLAHWASLMIQMPKVASIARDILPIQATSIPSERIFSRTKILAHNRNLTPARLEKLVVSSANMIQLEKMIPGHGGDVQEDENEFDASGENGLDQPAEEDGGAGASDGAEDGEAEGELGQGQD
jgi:hypothetical protein